MIMVGCAFELWLRGFRAPMSRCNHHAQCPAFCVTMRLEWWIFLLMYQPIHPVVFVLLKGLMANKV